MGGGHKEDVGEELASPSNPARTLVLVGRTGNGKSATGNTILGRKAFTSELRSVGVTSTCESHGVKLEDGQIINVVDTPGLFDLSTAAGFMSKEIVRCITLAEGGIHAVLLVFSVRSRLTEEEQSVLCHLQKLFGPKIVDYMIVVFTGGDELEDGDKKLEEYLAEGHPEFLKEILAHCDGRIVLFNNKTKDEGKNAEQVQNLLKLVDSVGRRNGGKPYMDELFRAVQEEMIKLRDLRREVEKDELQPSQIMERVERKLEETGRRLEKQLEEEKAARIEAEKRADELKKQFRDEIKMLREKLEKETEGRIEAEKRAKEFKKQFGAEIKELGEKLGKVGKKTEGRIEAEKRGKESTKQSRENLREARLGKIERDIEELREIIGRLQKLVFQMGLHKSVEIV